MKDRLVCEVVESRLKRAIVERDGHDVRESSGDMQSIRMVSVSVEGVGKCIYW